MLLSLLKRCLIIPILILIAALAWAAEEKPAPLLEGMGKLHHKITTKSELAQKYFNQGLTLSYGFNHAEAERSFREAARLDPDCAMAYWGVALVLGPNYNVAMVKEAVAPAYEAMQKAIALAPKVSKKEQDYIAALSKRYAPEYMEDRSKLDAAYAEAMGKLAAAYPDDPDAAALYGEALMDQHPWDLYTRDGKAKEWTPLIVSTIEKGMYRWLEHPGFHHFYIHAVEASDKPERGLHCVGLPELAPGAGHLVHMPAHIYIRVGRYWDAVVANEQAAKADDKYVSQCHAQGVYPLAYMPHNHHFLTAAAMLAGHSEKSIASARHLAAHQDKDLMRDPAFGPTIQHFWVTPIYVMVRFGKWEDLLKEPEPAKDLLYPIGIWHYARGMAYLRTGREKEAVAEMDALGKLANDPKMQEQKLFEINSTGQVLQIAHEVLSGEIEASRKNYDKAIAHFNKGVAMEDALMYQEPADWHASVRQNMGAVLLQAGKAAEAEEVFRKDLKFVPENGWSLYGLKEALKAQGKTDEAAKVDAQFQKAWSHADTKLASSRF